MEFIASVPPRSAAAAMASARTPATLPSPASPASADDDETPEKRRFRKRRASLIELQAAEELHKLEKSAHTTGTGHSSVMDRVAAIQTMLEREEASTAKEEVELMQKEKVALELQLREVNGSIDSLTRELGGPSEQAGEAGEAGEAGKSESGETQEAEGTDRFEAVRAECKALDKQKAVLQRQEKALNAQIERVVAISKGDVRVTPQQLADLKVGGRVRQ